MTEPTTPCHADAPSEESGSRSKLASPDSEQLSLLLVLGVQLLEELRVTNQLLQQSIGHSSMILDALTSESDDDDGSSQVQYLDQRN